MLPISNKISTCFTRAAGALCLENFRRPSNAAVSVSVTSCLMRRHVLNWVVELVAVRSGFLKFLNESLRLTSRRVHLALARENTNRFGRDNIYFAHLDSFTTLEQSLPVFDAFVSVIVLQHNPPPLIDWLLRTILRNLRPGGIAYFQVPTYRVNYSFKIKDYLNHALPIGNMEMHVLPQYRVFEILHRNGCRVLECREDGWTGMDDMISNSIVAVKDL